jgi:CheY-like chemotaxis protein
MQAEELATVQRILVVDDDPSITSLLKRGLAYEGFAVDTAATGADGLAVARERPPELVILDVMMPGLDGWDVLRRLPALAHTLGAKKPVRVPHFIGRLFAGQAGVVMMTELRGASNAKAKRELAWRPTHPSWREGFAT